MLVNPNMQPKGVSSRRLSLKDPEWDFEMYVENDQLVIKDRHHLASYNTPDLLDRIEVKDNYFYVPEESKDVAQQIRFNWQGACFIEAEFWVSVTPLPASSPQLVICSAPNAGAKLYITEDGVQTSTPGVVTRMRHTAKDCYKTYRLSYDGMTFEAECEGTILTGSGLVGNEWITFTGVAIRDQRSNGERIKSIKFKTM